jgi:hypothetical protein
MVKFIILAIVVCVACIQKYPNVTENIYRNIPANITADIVAYINV